MNLENLNIKTEKAVDKYLSAWNQLSAEQLSPILIEKASLFEPGLDKEEDKDEFIAIHEIWFGNIAESTMPGVITLQENQKSIVGTELVVSEIVVSSAFNELLFRFEVIHDDNTIKGIEITEADFLNVMRKYEISDNNQTKMSA